MDHSALDTIEKENQAANGDRGKTVEQTMIQLGKTAWDDVFEEGNFELPTTSFMKKIKQAVNKEGRHCLNLE